MKKSFIFGAALMLAGAFGLQSCSQETNAGSAGSPTMDEATYDAQTLTFKAFIEKHAVDGIVTLPADAKFTMEEAIELTEPLTITTDAEKPATIIAQVGFTTNTNITIENVIIDASNIGNALFNFTAPTEKVQKLDGTQSNYGWLKNVSINGVTIKGLAKSLVNNAGGNVFFEKFTINNSVIEIAKNSNSLFAFANGYAGEFELTNSTIWSKEGHTGFFFQAQGRPKDATGSTSWAIKNCTLYQIAVGKKMNNNNSGIKGQSTTTMILTNSILVNVGSSKGNEINGWLWGQNSASPVRTYENNTYWSVATAEAEAAAVAGWTDNTKTGYDASETALTTDPGFKDAANGDFTPTGADQLAKQTGDPRWFAVQ